MKIFNRNIPQEAHEKLDQLKSDGGITSFSFNKKDGWIIITGNNNFFCRNIADECYQRLNQLKDEGHEILNVSFCPYLKDSWVINTRTGSFSRNIPEECYNKIQEIQNEGKNIKQIIFPYNHVDKNSWIILFDINKVFARNIDDECYQIMKNFHQKSKMSSNNDQNLNFLAFEPEDGWVMSTKVDLFAREVNSELFSTMLEFRKQGHEISLVTFPPNRGWSIISNNNTNSIEWDVISKFEKNIGSKGIWNEMREQDVPGLSISVVENSKLKWSTSYGHLKRNTKKNAVHPTSLFQAASVSKVLAAIGAFKLIETGLVGLNDDLQNKLVNKIPVHNCFENYNQQESVTIKNILNHRSGIDGKRYFF